MQGAEQLYNTYVSLEGLGMETENTASPFLPCSTKHLASGLFTVLPRQTLLLLGAVLWGLAGLLAAAVPSSSACHFPLTPCASDLPGHGQGQLQVTKGGSEQCCARRAKPAAGAEEPRQRRSLCSLPPLSPRRAFAFLCRRLSLH